MAFQRDLGSSVRQKIPVLFIMTPAFFGTTMVLMFFYFAITEGTYCKDNIFMRVGTRGIVSCDFGEYETVGWLNPTEDLETTRPFIYREASDTHGRDSTSGEYAMFPNGSLIIKNVTFSHEKDYIARVFKDGEVAHHEVPVRVYALPVPEYPVVNGQTDQQHVVVNTFNGEASFKCKMDHIRPAVPLELVFVSPISNGISTKTIPSTLDNHDGTYNVSLDIHLTGIILPPGTYFLECRATERFADLFTSASAINLNTCDGSNKFPSVNGSYDQQHVVFMDVNRDGKLNCSVDRVVPTAYLEWNYTNHYLSSEISLERQSHFSVDNGDGTHNITSITSYKTIGESIKYATLKCVVSGIGALLYPLFTTVELHFPSVDGRHNFPLVNQLGSRQHVYLEVNREGTLNCSMNRVSSNIKLEFDFTNSFSLAEISLEELSHSSFDNGDGTYNITLVSTYKTKSKSVQYAIVRCMVSGKAAHLYPLFTTVELHFPAADSDSCSRLGAILSFIALTLVFICCLSLLLFQIIFRKQSRRNHNTSSKYKVGSGITEDLLTSRQKETTSESTIIRVNGSIPIAGADCNG